jgi:outer membrane protein TolC
MASSRNWLLKNGGRFFDLQSNAAQFVFNAKALRAKSRAAQQVLTQAATRYRNVVMLALQNMADALYVIEADDRALKEVEKAAQEAKENGEQTLKLYESGAVDFKTLRVAQQYEQRATINLLQAQTNRLGDTALLFQALGGGWWSQGIGDQAKANQP